MLRLSRSDETQVRDVAARLAVLRDRPAMGEVMDEVRQLVPAPRALAFSLESVSPQVRVDAVAATGFDAAFFRDKFDALLSDKPIDFTGWNAQRPEPWQRNKAVSVVDYLGWEGLQRLPAFRRVVVPLKFEKQHQLRALVCEGQSLLAWVGVIREEPFTARDRMVLQAVLPAIQRLLAVALRVQQAPFAQAAFATALEAIGAPAFVVRSGTTVVHANSAARVLLDSDRADTLQGLRASISGCREAPARATAIHAAGLPEHHLCIWRAARADLAPRVASFAHRYGLTPRQTEVLRHLVRGKPNKIIAAELGRAEVTIEVHVTAILAKAGCGSRAELVGRFWAGDVQSG